jgi:hypothetical protein
MKQQTRQIEQGGTTYSFSEGAVKGGLTGEASLLCDICLTSQRRSRTRTYRGKVYGIDCGCAGDIAQLAGKGK